MEEEKKETGGQEPAVTGKNAENEEKKTMLGMTEKLESALCYALSWISGIVFLVLEKENRTVRFHALQSIITFLSLQIVIWVAGIVPVVGPVLAACAAIGAFMLWIVLLVKTYQGEKFMVPVAGEMAEKMAK